MLKQKGIVNAKTLLIMTSSLLVVVLLLTVAIYLFKKLEPSKIETTIHNTDQVNSNIKIKKFTNTEKPPNENNLTKVSTYINITSPESQTTYTKESRYIISGTNTKQVNKIKVKYLHEKSGLSDDYFITKFKQGDTTWEYIADVKYKNLVFGANLYTIKAYQNDELLSTEKITINLTEIPGDEQVVTVNWNENIGPENEEDYNKYYLVGKVATGEYKDLDLYLSAQNTMGGYEFDHYVLKNDNKISFNDNNIKIASIIDLPEKIKLPETEYILEKSYNPNHLFSDYHVIKKLFYHETLGNIFLAYPKTTYDRILKGEEVVSSYSCLVAELKDHTAQIYNLPIEFIDEKRILDITFTDGEKNNSTYSYTAMVGCGSLCTPLAIVTEEDLKPDERLKIAGTTNTGEVLYQFKNPKDGYLVNLYNDVTTMAYYDQGKLEENKYSYEEFISMHPILYWQDPMDRWIRFKNNNFDVMAEMCKPVIYLYPEKTSDIKVKVEPNGGFIYTNPPYNNGWEVTADSNSKIIDKNTGQKYEYLFWEGIGLNYWTFNEGFVVQKNDFNKFFDEKLEILGLNKKEITDFKDYWVARLSEKPYYLITFVPQELFNEIAPLDIVPKPDSIIRVMMHAKELDYSISIKEQKLSTPKRDKFTVVEWGGAVVR